MSFEPSPRPVPFRALVISVAALLVPVLGVIVFPDGLGDYGALLWLTMVVPAFLLAYHRGWKGAATALAAGMATLSLTQAVVLWVRAPVPGILLAVVAAYVALVLGIGWTAEALHRQRAVVEDMAFTDLLTRLPNRRQVRLFLKNEFAAAERGRSLSVVVFDLDHFKDYNDQHGHPSGDEALKVFADILAGTTRRADLSARFGGEEFLSVLTGSDADGAVIFADRIRTTLGARRLDKGHLTVSAGAATYHSGMRSPDELLAAADHALYQAKRGGRNRVRLYGSTLAGPASPPDDAAGGPREPVSTEARARDAILKGVHLFVEAAELRFPSTVGHAPRVAAVAQRVALALDPTGEALDDETLCLACALKDVGHVSLPHGLLEKTGPFTPEERQTVMGHPVAGRRLLEALVNDDTVLAVVSWHHERWDGAGYPDHLAGEAIPLAARVAAVADALAAMTMQRPHRGARTWSEALEEVRREAGGRFDPRVVEAVGSCEEELEALLRRDDPSPVGA